MLPVEFVNTWTGQTACALQAAFRMSNEAFAEHLGVAVRTVASWHAKPGVTPRAEIQDALDTALSRAPGLVKARFAQYFEVANSPADTDVESAQALRVAVAVVVNETDVLVVCRRGEDGAGISWQFPAGMVKPGASPETVAVRETLGETGVHCAVLRKLGSRLHPVTHVFCEYVLCEYLTGDAQNMDVVENVSVVWIDKSKLTRFIPAQQIFPPILEALEVPE